MRSSTLAVVLFAVGVSSACGGDDDGGGSGGGSATGGSGGATGGSGGATGGSGGSTGGSGGATGGASGSGGSTGGASGSGGSTGGASGSGGATGGTGGATGGTGGATGGTGGATGGTGGATGGTGGATGGTGGATGGAGGTGGSSSQLTSVASVAGSHMDQDNDNLYVPWVGSGVGGGVKKIVKSSGAVSDLFTVSGAGCDMVAVNGSNVLAICGSTSTLGKKAVFRVPTSGGSPTEAYVSTTTVVGGLTKDGVFGGAPGGNVYFHDGTELKKLPAASGTATTLGTWSGTVPTPARCVYVGLDGGSYYAVLNKSLVSVPVAGGAVVPVASMTEGFTGLVADGTSVFFIETYYDVWKVPKAGGSKTKVNTGTTMLTESQLALNTDATFVYSAGSTNAVVRTPIGGGAPAVVATGTTSLKNATLLVDQTWVWVLAGGLYKAPK